MKEKSARAEKKVFGKLSLGKVYNLIPVQLHIPIINLSEVDWEKG